MTATLEQLLAYNRKVIPLSILAFFIFAAGILISVGAYFWFPEQNQKNAGPDHYFPVAGVHCQKHGIDGYTQDFPSTGIATPVDS